MALSVKNTLTRRHIRFVRVDGPRRKSNGKVDYAMAEREPSLMNTVNIEVLLTSNELAQRWSMSQKTLANHRCNGTGVPYIKIGVAVRYQLSDVIAFEKRITSGDAA